MLVVSAIVVVGGMLFAKAQCRRYLVLAFLSAPAIHVPFPSFSGGLERWAPCQRDLIRHLLPVTLHRGAKGVGKLELVAA